MKIIKFKLGGLWHSEYPLVIKRLTAIIARFNPEALHLQRAYSVLAAFGPQLDQMEKQELADADSTRLSELDQVRDTLFSVTLAVASAFKRAPVREYSEPALVILALLKKHGHDIPAANYTAETKRLYDLCANFRRQPEALDALGCLSLRPLFEHLESANVEFDKLFMLRHENRASAGRVDSRVIRAECDKAITAVWNAIEFCMVEYGEDAYTDLVNAINRYNAYYKQQLAARATRRKAKENVSGEKPISPAEV
ncbi:MAG: DUF6261 family protein [Bacteroidales bacterium]|jgi:hypothetical protein|nr:DUF6261 family protein [Bacteroidales bacterium]